MNRRLNKLPAISRLHEVLDYCKDTGLICWRINAGPRARAGSVAGTVIKGGYRKILIDRSPVLAHRIAWAMVNGVWPSADIDHINGQPDDNRIENLRDVSRSENLMNRHRARCDNICGVLGATWHKSTQRWRARITVNGKERHLGLFDSAEAAQKAYLWAKVQLHPTAEISQKFASGRR
jgi:hypothetical protein